MRNAIIHRGIQPNGDDAYAAQAAYSDLRDHLENRLVAKRMAYPRTLMVRIDEDRLRERGVLSRNLEAKLNEIKKEALPFYWPYDVANRKKPATGSGTSLRVVP